MSMVKKIIAVFLAALMMMSVSAFSVSAATVAPEFKVTLVSETDSTVVVRFSLVKGSFNALDFTMYTSSAIKECKNLETTEEFDNLVYRYMKDKKATVSSVANPKAMKAAVIATASIDAPVSLFDATFIKKTSASVKSTDVAVVIDNCNISSGNSTGNSNIDVTDDAKVTVSLGNFSLNETAVAMNYKASHTIDYSSNYAADTLTWTSSNEKVATVDENGNIYATGTGSATITVTSADGVVNETCEVTVSYTVVQWIIIIVLFGWIWY